MLTLLLDLDDTLLDTNMDTFIPAYFQALAKHMSACVDSDVMLPALVAGTRGMMGSKDPGRTLREVFDLRFYPGLGIDREDIQPVLEDFYDNVFPGLGTLTTQRPEAVELVTWAFKQGFRVAVATDPFFPLKATQHRLRFAGLAPEDFPFERVSSYETFHFTKSHAAYYAEFLGQLGWPDGPILMVGNDVERDLLPAQQLGLATFWINNTGQADGARPQPTGRGSLADLKAWLGEVDLKTLEPRFNTKEAILALLTAAPASIASLSRELPVSEWTRRPASGEWSLVEVLCHLRDSECEVNQPRLERLMHETEPFIAGRSTPEWSEARGYIHQDGNAAFQEYLTARLGTLETLKGLSEGDWSRKARHSIFGPTTLQEMVGFMATHDRIHIQQIWKLLNPSA